MFPTLVKQPLSSMPRHTALFQPLLSFRASLVLAPSAALHWREVFSLIYMHGTCKPHALSQRHNRSCLLLISDYAQTVSAAAKAFHSGFCGRQTSRAGRMRGCEKDSMTNGSYSLPFSFFLSSIPAFHCPRQFQLNALLYSKDHSEA